MSLEVKQAQRSKSDKNIPGDALAPQVHHGGEEVEVLPPRLQLRDGAYDRSHWDRISQATQQ